jgi:Tfp pilus assembly protein PilX
MLFPGRCTPDADGSAGSALVIVLIGLLLLTALGLATVLLATADTLAASNQRDARAAFYAAEAGIELAAAELVGEADWDAVLSGATTSMFADGSPSDATVLPDGSTIRPDQVARLATCGDAANCSTAACEAVTEDRPWGRNNPLWRPYRYGFVNGGGSGAGVYVVVLVGDDPAETDDDPQRDGVAPGNPGAGVITVRAEAFGPGGARRSVEAVVTRVTTPSGLPAPRMLSWREVR